jgi:hypothetical protein
LAEVRCLAPDDVVDESSSEVRRSAAKPGSNPGTWAGVFAISGAWSACSQASRNPWTFRLARGSAEHPLGLPRSSSGFGQLARRGPRSSSGCCPAGVPQGVRETGCDPVRLRPVGQVGVQEVRGLQHEQHHPLDRQFRVARRFELRVNVPLLLVGTERPAETPARRTCDRTRGASGSVAGLVRDPASSGSRAATYPATSRAASVVAASHSLLMVVPRSQP